ncbi:hypothetical protein LDL36_20470 [Komagataeibacter sp. FNDCR1]|nr:hypothetical protein [Komagataeibacter sp. FNDCR1]
MPRIVSKIPHTSSEVNGVKFSPDKGQMVSEEVSDDVAAHFKGIKGYRVVEDKKSTSAVVKPAGKTDGSGTGGGAGTDGETDASKDDPAGGKEAAAPAA